MKGWVGLGTWDSLKGGVRFTCRPTTAMIRTWQVSLASIGTTPWSVMTARFSSSLAIHATAAQTPANTSMLSDLSRLITSSRPPTKLRTISPESYTHNKRDYICNHRTKTPPRPLHCREEARWHPLTSENILYQTLSRNVNASGQVIVHPHPDSDQHQNLTSSRSSTLNHALNGQPLTMH